MLPFILFQMICAIFAGHLDCLKEMRRGKLPANWQDHLERLRDAEWPVLVVLAEGARRILAGQNLTLTGIPLDDPPADQIWSAPTSAWQTHLRIEALARFHSDPETYVRRHARRIAARAAARRFGLIVADIWLVFVCVPSVRAAPVSAPAAPERIRAPP